MNFDFFPTPDSEPRTIDLFSSEWERRFASEATLYRRKIEPLIKVECVLEPQTIETLLPNGIRESSTEARSGDWIITGPKNERFVVTADKFVELYESNGQGSYVPKERKILVVRNPYAQPIKIAAPWGTIEKPAYQEGGADCYIVISLDEKGRLTSNRYLIGDEELLLSNYEKFDI